MKRKAVIVCLCLCGGANAQPIITQQPFSQTKPPGAYARFSVAAQGAAPMNYQWQFNGVDLPNARQPTLQLIATPSWAGTYRAIVRDQSGQEQMSASANLEVKPRPTVLLQPKSVVVREHGTAVFEVRFIASGPYTHINWHNYNSVEGSHEIPEGIGLDVHSTRLEIPNCLNAFNYNGLYWICATNEVGGTVSRKARLTVVSPPQLYSGPENRSVPRGGTVVFAVTIAPDNAGTKRKQWYKNGQPIPGATGRILRLSRVQASAQGTYYCVVSSIGGSTESNSATLTVF